MFAIPGISALIFWILARPQEFIVLLQKIPLLHIFTLLAVVGYVVDLRLRRLQPIAAPSLRWVAAFLGWALLSCAVLEGENLIARTIEFAILFAIYGTIAHGIQRLRTFQLIATVLVGTTLVIAGLCFYEGVSPKQCVGAIEGGDGLADGHPDGRECETKLECSLGPQAQQGMDYRCEHVGLFDMHSVEGRTRYIGELHDPNEVALVISTCALSLLIGFMLRNRGRSVAFAIAGLAILVMWTVLLTQSRGGLIASMLVPGVYLVKRYGLVAVIPAVLVAVPVMMVAGRSDDGTDESTMERYEAWEAGMGMFRGNPALGVGPKQFSQHHVRTAHNSYVLVMSELGLPGLFFFVAILYISIKTLVVGLRELEHVPGAGAARIWGMALLASMCGATFQINTLSFCYHSALWVLFGMAGAWFSAVRHHRPEFQVRLVGRDLAIIGGIVTAYCFVVLPTFLHTKGLG